MNKDEKKVKDEKPAEEKPQDNLQKKTEELQKQKEEYLDGWKRERADFLNYKKEEMERIGELIKYANEELILRMLPILDNFFIAEKNIPEDMKKDGLTGSPQVNWVKGLLQIHRQLKDFLKSRGVEEIKAVGERFNPNFHETVGEISNTQHLTPNTIVEETQKGYTLFGKVVRPAKVRITK